MTLIDIHTHKSEKIKGVLSVQNLVLTPSETPKFPGNPYTVGVHPWWPFEKGKQFLDVLEKLFHHPLCVGLGEIGLDRVKGGSFQHQQWTFDQQIAYASLNDVQMVVIHAVKTYPEIWQSIKQCNFKGKILFHDFNGDEEFTKLAVKRDEVYFSFGSALFRKATSGLQSIKHIPRERILFETDDHESRSIEMVYRRGQEVLEIEWEELLKLVNQNAKNLLGRAL